VRRTCQLTLREPPNGNSFESEELRTGGPYSVSKCGPLASRFRGTSKADATCCLVAPFAVVIVVEDADDSRGEGIPGA
jgi:hypothetical protein